MTVKGRRSLDGSVGFDEKFLPLVNLRQTQRMFVYALFFISGFIGVNPRN